MSFTVALNQIPHSTYESEQAARRAVQELFGACEISSSDARIMFWPSVSARGHVMVEIRPAA